jgi:ABC-2 type transport system ATP-binding protein
MSIKVVELTKIYEDQKAVDSLSFEAVEGRILGFLGPNGAGKSTTMKVATGYLPPSSGTVYVKGLDVRKHSLKIRKMIGYLPEQNPLYTDMYVPEFLKFCGGLYGLSGKKLKGRIEEMIRLCGLGPEQHKKIGKLSKGYRQRVGLAQALIHEPEVLILDEPTSGLDPNQITEIRNLIKTLSLQKTVILSTHIMQEVEALCQDVVIINKGKIVGSGGIEELTQGISGEMVIRVEFSHPPAIEELMRLEGVVRIEFVHARLVQLFCARNKDPRKAILQFAADHALDILGLYVQKNSLEEVFANLTRNGEQG